MGKGAKQADQQSASQSNNLISGATFFLNCDLCVLLVVSTLSVTEIKFVSLQLGFPHHHFLFTSAADFTSFSLITAQLLLGFCSLSPLCLLLRSHPFHLISRHVSVGLSSWGKQRACCVTRNLNWGHWSLLKKSGIKKSVNELVSQWTSPSSSQYMN